MSRKLGDTQEKVLAALHEHTGWTLGCGWVWSTQRQTEKIMDSLVKRGLVIKTPEGHYYPAGKENPYVLCN